MPRSVYGGVEDDRPVPARMVGPLAEPAENSVLFAAVPEDLVVQEVLIEGEVRGALSWSFARGMEGAADTNEDRTVTVRELASYVPESVRALSQSRQTPVVTVRGGMEIGLFAPPDSMPEAPIDTSQVAFATPPPAAAVPDAATPDLPLRLALDGPNAADGAPILSRLEGWSPIPVARI